MKKGERLDLDPATLIQATLNWINPEDDRLKLLPAEEFRSIPHDQLRVWAGMTARYGFPTLELVEWLKDYIGDRKAIEVASGNADLGYHLGITQTDSYLQQASADVRARMQAAGQLATNPRPDVLRLDAESAVQKLKPDVVVASWLTRRFIRDVDVRGEAEANAYGPVEEKLIRGCAEYIHIGNMGVHSQKTILGLPHETYYFPWLVSRAADQSLNMIQIWKNPHYPTGRRNK